MQADAGKMTVAAAAFALIGIAMLLFMSETAQSMSVAQASVAQDNTLVTISGTAANVTGGKFALCSKVCISVQDGTLPLAALLSNGRQVAVTGRVQEYMGRRYIEAESIEVG